LVVFVLGLYIAKSTVETLTTQNITPLEYNLNSFLKEKQTMLLPTTKWSHFKWNCTW